MYRLSPREINKRDPVGGDWNHASSNGTTYGLPDLADLYVAWHSYAGHTETTVSTYRSHLKLFIDYLQTQAHSLELQDLTPYDLMDHLEDLKARDRSARYLKSRHQHVSTFLLWAEGLGYISRDNNPARRVPTPKVPKIRKGFLKPEWFSALVEACTPPDTLSRARRLAMLFLFSTTGIRHRELWGLAREDLDWKEHLIHVRLGKGQKDRRIPFHPETERAILGYLRHRKDHMPELWVTEHGAKLSYWGISQDMRRLMDLVGINGQVPDVCHIFRRTWAANAVRQGIPRPYIMAVAGWSTPDMLDRYTQEMQMESGAVEAFSTFDPFAS